MRTGDVVEGRYRIIKTLGEGGMGTVFLAEHTLIKRRVAIKVLHPELAKDAEVIERFMNEARAAGTLGHPNIVESTDMGHTHTGVPFIVFEFLEGSLLTDEIYRVGGLPVRRAVRIAEQIASALHAAHNAGIVHRDLKSDNVFLTDKDDILDHVKVLDFGISRFIQQEEQNRHMVLGTPEFMAPEQISAPESVDRRADIYALGVILYEMLTARRPFSSDDEPRALMHRIVHEAPPPLQRPEVPEGLARLILNKLLAKEPAERFASMADVEAALLAYATGPVPAAIRRRSQPIKVAEQTEFDAAQAETAASIPRLAGMAATPYPAPQLDTLDVPPAAMQAVVALGAPPPAKRPWVLYGIASAGMAIGAIGLVMGMRTPERHDPPQVIVQPPAPVARPAAAMPAPAQPQKIAVTFEADAPDARIVFRRRLTGSPTEMTITASDIVELVEITAPGFKTQRYWLTFDRPTHLKAHLVKGAGLVEATEEETLIALGEIAAPTAIAAAPQPQEEVPHARPEKHDVVAAARPAPAPAVESAPPVAVTTIEPAAAPAPDRSAPHVAARRRIGRAAAESMPAMTASTDQPPAELAAVPTPPAPVAEPPQAAPPVEKPAAPPPPAEKPGFAKAQVSAVVAAHRPEVIKCITEGKKKDPKMKGTITLQLLVDPAGKVHRVQVQSTLTNPLVAACVVKSANSWRFPARPDADVTTVAYPFTVN